MRGLAIIPLLCATTLVAADARDEKATKQPTLCQTVSSLHDAAKLNDVASAKILLDRGISVNVHDSLGNTPLFWAALNDSEEMIHLLCDHGADVNATNRGGRTALHYAAYSGALVADELLLAGGAKSNVTDSMKLTPQGLARIRGYPALHVPKGVGFHTFGPGQHPSDWLFVAIAKDDWKQAKAALDAGANGKTMLTYAAQYSGAEIVELLLDHHADPNDAEPILNRIPLSLAVRYGKDARVIELLLAAGADPLMKDRNGKTPLDEAKERDDKWIIELLTADWKRVNEPDDDGHSRLDRAAFVGDRYYARLLIAKGANVNARDRDGRTPLHTAVAWGKRDVAEMLVASGADVNAVDDYGLTPLFESRDATLTECLTAHGAKIDARDKTGQTPLHWAAASGNEKVAEALLNVGADPNAVDKFNRTPAQVAREERKDAVAKLLSK